MKKQTRWACVLLAGGAVPEPAGRMQRRGGGHGSVRVCRCGAGEPGPLYAVSAADQTILTHLYENLMQASVDENGALTAVSGMAKSAESETDVDGNVTWTFRLRSAKWSDGKKVAADDFVYAWQRLADPERNSPYASLLSIVAGYEEARASGDMSLLRVSAENDSTLVVVLNGNYEWFLTQVCTATATMPLRRDLMERWEPGGERGGSGAICGRGREHGGDGRGTLVERRVRPGDQRPLPSQRLYPEREPDGRGL